MEDRPRNPPSRASDGAEERLARESQRMFGETVVQIRAYQAGDNEVLDDLFARYYPIVRRIVCSRMGHALGQFAAVEDVAQEALLHAFAGLAEFENRSEGTFRSWLARIVQSRVEDLRRRSTARKRGSGKVLHLSDAFHDDADDAKVGPVANSPSPSQCARGHELEQAREAALLRMSEFHRELINLRENCGMTHAEIAAELDLNQPNTARIAYHRARSRLRQILGEMGYGAPG